MASCEEACPSDMYYYQAFGLTIESTIPCPELLSQPGEPEVFIHYGAVPDALDEVQAQTGWYQQNSEAVLLKIDSIANYLILKGNKIIIDKAMGSHDDEVRLFLFGSAFGALLHQRGLLPVHGSAVEVNGGAMVFVGLRGFGKSSLAGAFQQRGYRIIADDVCVLSPAKEAAPSVYSGFPRLKLWPDTLEKLGKNPQGLRKIIPAVDKRHLPLGKDFCARSRPLRRIYELTVTDAKEFNLTPLQGLDKLAIIIGHTYRPEFLSGANKKKLHFMQCAAIIHQVEVSRVTRPRQPFRLGDLADLVEHDWGT
jgi:hypothetical protein